MRHLLLDLDAPLMSFGGEMVDAYGVVRDFPAKSMVAGLIANALGWERQDAAAHAALQERLAVGSARLAEGQRLREYQTAKLGMADAGWRTVGGPEGRETSPSYWDDWQEFYNGGMSRPRKVIPHIRHRDMDADARVVIALRLADGDGLDLDAVADALARPERPLFVGRKPFLPSRPLLLGIVEADDIPAALLTAMALVAGPPPRRDSVRAQWPVGEAGGPVTSGACEEELTDERHWPAGVHAGLRRVMQGAIAWPAPATPPAAADATA